MEMTENDIENHSQLRRTAPYGMFIFFQQINTLIEYILKIRYRTRMSQKSKDGFRPMEIESVNDHTEWRLSLRTAGMEQYSKTTIAGIVVGSLVLGFLALRIVTSEEHTPWNAGFLPGNNVDEAFPTGTKPPDVAPEAPLALRDSGRIVQLGVAPSNWDPDLPRQSQESTIPLLDPPVLLPDPYGWLRDDDRENPTVLEYLYAENNYTTQRLNHLTPLADELFRELLQYMDETSHSFPILDRNYFYYRRTIEGLPYPQHCRAPRANAGTSTAAYLQEHLSAWDGTSDSPILPGEVVYLDENALAPGHTFFSIGDIAVSPSETLVACTVDTTGNELYHLRIMDIPTGRTVLQDESLILSDALVWGLDDDTLFYSKPDETERTYEVYKFSVSSQTEELLYEEPDTTYWVGFGLTSDEKYLLVETSSSESSEVYYLKLDEVNAGVVLTSISARRMDVLYSVDHYEGHWWILSNLNDSEGDMQLWTLPVGQESHEDWSLVHDPSSTESSWLDKIAIEDISIFQYHIVIEGRYEGIKDIWILSIDPEDASKIAMMERVEFLQEQAHTVELGINMEYTATNIIIDFVSMVTPSQQIQIDLFHPNADEQRLVLYERRVPGYQKDQYQCTRVHVLSRDGRTKIPVSLVYRASTWTKLKERGELVPIHLYSYGAYGDSVDDYFSTTRLALLDRGMIFAVAHVRGGGEMGRKWYMDGKLLKKHNTFDDFVDVGRYFVDEEWTTSDMLSCEGRSAGGLTMGASLNQAPELFRAAVLGVPFVDLVVTMSDASIPLVRRNERVFLTVDRDRKTLCSSLCSMTALPDHGGMERVGKSQRSGLL